MLIKQFYSKLTDILKLKPTPSQTVLFTTLASFTLEFSGMSILIVKGYAGTGKTTALSSYVSLLNEFGYKVVLLAPTGRAAKVFSNYAKVPAFTIHKKIYRQKSSKDGFGKFELDANLYSRTIFIVDEASMISNSVGEGSIFGSGYLLNDLIDYVNNTKGCKLILVGDVAQLPPVGLNVSPALDIEEVRLFGPDVTESQLTDVVRQAENSGILINATTLRKKLEQKDVTLPLFTTKNFTDIVYINGTEFLEALDNSYSIAGVFETLIVCKSNKRANQFNQGIRNQILWRESELAAGDLLMVVKNNYFWLNEFKDADFIANGDIIEVLKVYGYTELYGFRYAQCHIRLIDYGINLDVKLMLDALHSESASLSYEENKKVFYNILEDYEDIKPKKKQYEKVRENEYFNALQVKYAYAVTCHKAQGGQWKHVYVDAGYLTKDSMDNEYLRWLYTAVTRATEKLYLVNFPQEFIQVD